MPGLRFWVRVVVVEHAGSGSEVSSAPSSPVYFSDGGDGHTRLPRGDSSIFLWTTDLDRAQSIGRGSVRGLSIGFARTTYRGRDPPPPSRSPVLFAATQRSRVVVTGALRPRLVVTAYAAINTAETES
jgi:hypothetical protein